MTRSVEFIVLGLAMERKKFEPWRRWESSAKLAENEKFKDPENEDKHPWAYSQGEQQMIIEFSQIFSENFKGSIPSCEYHCRRPKSFKKHCLSCGKAWKSSTGKQNKEPRTLLKSRQFH